MEFEEIKIPPHAFEYQNHLDPDPRLPPFRYNVVEAPWQITDDETDMKEGEVDSTFIEIKILLQFVVLHIPSPLIK